MEVTQESHYSEFPDAVTEHSTTRRNHVWLTNEDKVNIFTGAVTGNVMEIIREESRQIYIIGGNTPAIYFDLNMSPLFVKICNGIENPHIGNLLFSWEQLSITKFNNIDEEKIEDSIKKFQEQAKILIENDIVGGIIKSGVEAHFHEKVHNSKSILLKLSDIVHDKKFIIQQNRDIYRELCNHACVLLSKNEISNVVQTRWNQDLDRCLFSDRYDTNIDMNMLGCLVEQFIEVIQLNQVLGMERRKISALQLYSRNMVKKARLEMKDENDLAWKKYPGRWNYQFINLRNQKIEENRMEFYRKTDWGKLKNDFDSDFVERKKQAQIDHESYVRGRNEYYKNVARYERNEDDAHKHDEEIEQISGEDTKNNEQAETETEAGEIEQVETEQVETEQEAQKNDLTQFHEVKQEAVTYKIWIAALKQETVISDDTNEKIIKCMLALKSTITKTTVDKIDDKLDKVLENFRKSVMRNHFVSTNANRKIMSVCYLELISRTNRIDPGRESLVEKNLSKLKDKLEKLSIADYNYQKRYETQIHLKSEYFATAYINPYLI